MKNKINILGVQVDNLTRAQALEEVERFLASPSRHYIATPNPEFAVAAQSDEEFKEILNRADLAVPDGAGLFFAAPLFSLKERISGVDFMEKICRLAEQSGRRVFLLGGKNGAAETAILNLRKRYPALIAAFHEDHENCGEAILKFKPEVLFVALGAPKQEKWIYRNAGRFPSVKVAMGVGGAFDFLSGKIKRAPRLMRKLGLEWLWRLMMEPKRAKRIFNAVIVFPWLVIQSRIKKQVTRPQGRDGGPEGLSKA